MEGLINSVQAPAVATQGPVQPPPVGVPGQDQGVKMPPLAEKGSGFATDQQEVDMFIANGIKLVHSPASSDQILNAVLGAKNKVVGLAEAGLQVINRIEESAAKSGKSFALSTIAQGGNRIMGEIAEIANLAGAKLEDKAKYSAYSLAVSKYIDNAIRTGRMSQEQLSSYAVEAAGTEDGQKIIGTSNQLADEGQKGVA